MEHGEIFFSSLLKNVRVLFKSKDFDSCFYIHKQYFKTNKIYNMTFCLIFQKDKKIRVNPLVDRKREKKKLVLPILFSDISNNAPSMVNLQRCFQKNSLYFSNHNQAFFLKKKKKKIFPCVKKNCFEITSSIHQKVKRVIYLFLTVLAR